MVDFNSDNIGCDVPQSMIVLNKSRGRTDVSWPSRVCRVWKKRNMEQIETDAELFGKRRRQIDDALIVVINVDRADNANLARVAIDLLVIDHVTTRLGRSESFCQSTDRLRSF